MPLPEGYLPREGDVLIISGTVEYDVEPHAAYIFLKVPGYGSGSLGLNPTRAAPFLSLKRRGWREDEGVIHKHVDRWFGKVVSQKDDYVVVALDAKAQMKGSVGGLRIFHCNELLPWPGAKSAGEDGDDIAEPAPPLPAAEPEEKDDGTDFVPKF
jgi:hypothetical protein